MPLLIENPTALRRAARCASGLGCTGCVNRRSCGLSGFLGFLGDSPIVPSGSQLVYKTSWAQGFTDLLPPAQIAASVKANVEGHSGMTVVSSTADTSWINANNGMSLTIQLNQDYTNAAMVQSVLDSAVTAAGRQVVSSNISVVTGPAAGSGNAPPATAPRSGPDAAAPFDVGTFLTTYGGWIAAGLVGFVLVKKIL